MTAETAELFHLAPKEAARVLLQEADETWIVDLQRSLDRQRGCSDFDRILAVWNLNQSDAGELFHISRQAIGKWRIHGVPKERVEAIADLAAATDLLLRHLKPERIPAIVRRPSANLGGRSLLELAASGRTREVLLACRRMFQFGDVHA